MLKISKLNLFAKSYFANDLDAFIPEFWANESLAVLEENLVATNLCYRDFENTLAKKGDTVNCQRPNRFTPVRKDLTDNVTVQDATATAVPVKLDQHLHISFLIRDGEESKSNKDLISEYIVPAMKGNARFLDAMVLGQYGSFIDNNAGKLQGQTSGTAKGYLIDLRKKTNDLLWPDISKPLIHTTASEAALLNTDLFVAAEQVGDNGTALRDASLGKKFGFVNLLSQQMGYVIAGQTIRTGAINNASGYAKATTGALVIDGFTGVLVVGSFIDLDGIPYRVTATTATLGNATGMTLDRALDYAVVDNAVITVYTPGAVNFASGYAAGYSKEITIDGFSAAKGPQKGQMISIGAATSSAWPIYTVMAVNGIVGITLDRPLESSIADNDIVAVGPVGSYNFTFLQDALALVVRPLAMPKAGTGALSSVANYNNLSMRATITYDGNKQGHLVTLDLLCGIKVLDHTFGAVMFG